MPDQKPGEVQYPPTPEGDYRKAADTLRAAIDDPVFVGDKSQRQSLQANHARQLADLAIRMTAAQNGAGLAAIEPPPDEQGAPQ